MYAITGHYLFGAHLDAFSTFAQSLDYVLRITLTDWDYEQLVDEDYLLGALFFWSYVAISALLLLNVLLSIVVESLVEVQGHTKKVDGVLSLTWGHVWFRIRVLAIRYKALRW